VYGHFFKAANLVGREWPSLASIKAQTKISLKKRTYRNSWPKLLADKFQAVGNHQYIYSIYIA
jgi:hypothetical protein